MVATLTTLTRVWIWSERGCTRLQRQWLTVIQGKALAQPRPEKRREHQQK